MQLKTLLHDFVSFGFDAWMTAFWIGFACICAGLISRRESVMAIIVFWCVCFPVFEHLLRDSLRAVFIMHPDRLWALVAAAVTSYVLAFCIVSFCFVRHLRKPRPGIG